MTLQAKTPLGGWLDGYREPLQGFLPPSWCRETWKPEIFPCLWWESFFCPQISGVLRKRHWVFSGPRGFLCDGMAYCPLSPAPCFLGKEGQSRLIPPAKITLTPSKELSWTRFNHSCCTDICREQPSFKFPVYHHLKHPSLGMPVEVCFPTF